MLYYILFNTLVVYNLEGYILDVNILIEKIGNNKYSTNWRIINANRNNLLKPLASQGVRQVKLRVS